MSEITGWVVNLTPGAIPQVWTRADHRLPARSDPAWFAALQAACMRDALDVPSSRLSEWAARLTRLTEETQNERLGDADASIALTMLTLIDIARMVMDDVEYEHAQTSADSRVVAEVLVYIDAHFGDPISLDDVAKALARSPANLARMVRRATGRTVNQWIDDRRMTEAHRLLLQTDLSVEQVAGSLGFRDAGYFGRRFKSRYGLSPVNWRARARSVRAT